MAEKLNYLKFEKKKEITKDSESFLKFLQEILKVSIDRINASRDIEEKAGRIDGDTTKMLNDAVVISRMIFDMKYPDAKITGLSTEKSESLAKTREEYKELFADEDDVE